MVGWLCMGSMDGFIRRRLELERRITRRENGDGRVDSTSVSKGSEEYGLNADKAHDVECNQRLAANCNSDRCTKVPSYAFEYWRKRT